MLGLVSSAVRLFGEADTTLVVNCVVVLDWGVTVRVFNVDDVDELRVVCEALVVPEKIVVSGRRINSRRQSEVKYLAMIGVSFMKNHSHLKAQEHECHLNHLTKKVLLTFKTKTLFRQNCFRCQALRPL